MREDGTPVTLLTCSGISHTGRLTTLTGISLRCRHPTLISCHLQLTSLKRPLEEEISDAGYLIAVDGCGECCAGKRLDAIGKKPHCHVIATKEGITKRGMEEVRYDELETLSRVIASHVKERSGENAIFMDTV
jgi:uncharacterized metal-binding protein